MFVIYLSQQWYFRYDQTLFEDEQKNRMMETKELFDWVLKQPCFEVCYNATSTLLVLSLVCKLMGMFTFMLFFLTKLEFLNKFDIFEKKVLKVSANERYTYLEVENL